VFMFMRDIDGLVQYCNVMVFEVVR
jgi:hypothetical protein